MLNYRNDTQDDDFEFLRPNNAPPMPYSNPNYAQNLYLNPSNNLSSNSIEQFGTSLDSNSSMNETISKSVLFGIPRLDCPRPTLTKPTVGVDFHPANIDSPFVDITLNNCDDLSLYQPINGYIQSNNMSNTRLIEHPKPILKKYNQINQPQIQIPTNNQSHEYLQYNNQNTYQTHPVRTPLPSPLPNPISLNQLQPNQNPIINHSNLQANVQAALNINITQTPIIYSSHNTPQQTPLNQHTPREQLHSIQQPTRDYQTYQNQNIQNIQNIHDNHFYKVQQQSQINDIQKPRFDLNNLNNNNNNNNNNSNKQHMQSTQQFSNKLETNVGSITTNSLNSSSNFKTTNLTQSPNQVQTNKIEKPVITNQYNFMNERKFDEIEDDDEDEDEDEEEEECVNVFGETLKDLKEKNWSLNMNNQSMMKNTDLSVILPKFQYVSLMLDDVDLNANTSINTKALAAKYLSNTKSKFTTNSIANNSILANNTTLTNYSTLNDFNDQQSLIAFNNKNFFQLYTPSNDTKLENLNSIIQNKQQYYSTNTSQNNHTNQIKLQSNNVNKIDSYEKSSNVSSNKSKEEVNEKKNDDSSSDEDIWLFGKPTGEQNNRTKKVNLAAKKKKNKFEKDFSDQDSDYERDVANVLDIDKLKRLPKLL